MQKLRAFWKEEPGETGNRGFTDCSLSHLAPGSESMHQGARDPSRLHGVYLEDVQSRRGRNAENAWFFWD